MARLTVETAFVAFSVILEIDFCVLSFSSAVVFSET